MIPYLLAALGGYLIGESQKKENEKSDAPQMAKGGSVKSNIHLYHHKTSGGAEYLCSSKVKGSKDEGSFDSKYTVRMDGAKKHGGELYIRDEMGRKEIKLYYHKTSGGAEYLMSSALKGTDEGSPDSKYIVRIDGAKTHGGELMIKDKMEDGGMMYAKGGKVKKKWIQDALGGDEGSLRRTAKRKGLLRGDENLSMTDLKKLQKMGGKTAKRAHLAETLRKFDDGGMTDYYEDLRVYVQGVGTIYKGNSLSEATDVFDEYYANNPHAEMVMVDEKYGDEIKWANTSSTDDNDD